MAENSAKPYSGSTCLIWRLWRRWWRHQHFEKKMRFRFTVLFPVPFGDCLGVYLIPNFRKIWWKIQPNVTVVVRAWYEDYTWIRWWRLNTTPVLWKEKEVQCCIGVFSSFWKLLRSVLDFELKEDREQIQPNFGMVVRARYGDYTWKRRW